MTREAPLRPSASRGGARAFFPPLQWLRDCSLPSLRSDLVAGVTLAAYALPVALAYATLVGLPQQMGVYGHMLGGLGCALLCFLAWALRLSVLTKLISDSILIGFKAGRSADGDVRLRRRLLRPDQAPLGPGLPLAHRIRSQRHGREQLIPTRRPSTEAG
ncbi:hypothetical protein DFH01_12815 [Falsiroseomonas bella]|uniref:SLC26A/SulP transporter domain-containing protein n=1 Tax=Falsiroseomonas bella TaxID=2184016 RepID=A0A317FC62_9PROT|nr:hypothetical protein DFH01_12815 [Falsiroseomonas bella]